MADGVRRSLHQAGRHRIALTRRVLFRLGNSEIFDAAVRAWRPLRAAAYRRARCYVAGATLADALETVSSCLNQGFACSIDCLGWYVDDARRITAVTEEYLRLAAALQRLRADVYVSLDLTHFGLVTQPQRCLDHVRRVAAALPPSARIQIGAEAAREGGPILAAVGALADTGVPVVATLQANLRRSVNDAEFLAERGIPVRLCKGAYVESPADAYAWGTDTDTAYVALAYKLAARVPVALATHDAAILASLLPALPEAGVEALFGVRVGRMHVVAQRRRVRIYVPYGDGWFRYYLHRIAEARGA